MTHWWTEPIVPECVGTCAAGRDRVKFAFAFPDVKVCKTGVCVCVCSDAAEWTGMQSHLRKGLNWRYTQTHSLRKYIKMYTPFSSIVCIFSFDYLHRLATGPLRHSVSMVVECNRKGLQKHTFLNARYKANRALGIVDRVKYDIPQGFSIFQQSLRQSTALVKGVSSCTITTPRGPQGRPQLQPQLLNLHALT